MSEVVGLLKTIGEVQVFGANGFRKRSVVLTIPDDKYPQYIPIDFTQDKCDLLNNYVVGQEVKISLNLGGRLWINPQGEEKCFASITGWRIESVQTAPQQEQAPPEQFEEESGIGDDDLDLPF